MAVTALTLLFLLMNSGGANRTPPSLLVEMATGDYVIVGREPDGGATYAGRARIERRGEGLALIRTAGGVSTTLVGGIERAAGGDAQVIRFRGPKLKPRTLTCLPQGDLDNYLRLTCYWTYDAFPSPKEPGLETMFPRHE